MTTLYEGAATTTNETTPPPQEPAPTNTGVDGTASERHLERMANVCNDAISVLMKVKEVAVVPEHVPGSAVNVRSIAPIGNEELHREADRMIQKLSTMVVGAEHFPEHLGSLGNG